MKLLRGETPYLMEVQIRIAEGLLEQDPTYSPYLTPPWEVEEAGYILIDDEDPRNPLQYLTEAELATLEEAE